MANEIDLEKIDKMSSYEIGELRDKKIKEMNELTSQMGVIAGEIYKKEVDLAALKETKRKGGVERSNLKNVIEVLKNKYFSAKDDNK